MTPENVMASIDRPAALAHEQTRARYPDRIGHVKRDGVQVYWELYGDGEPTVMFLPPWSILHSRLWKAQIPYLARHARAVAFDPRGNGRSDRPLEAWAYDETAFAADALAVMDAAASEQVVLVAPSLGAQRALLLAAHNPQRVTGICFVAPALPLTDARSARFEALARFDQPRDTYRGWAKYSRHYWTRDFRGFLEFFFGQVFVEPHSTKQIEDAVGWALETNPEALMASDRGAKLDRQAAADLCRRVRCPVVIVQGSDDRIIPPTNAAALAEATGGRLVVFEGSGHSPQVRDPVRFNRVLRDFALPNRIPRQTWVRGRHRPRRALYISSPIGLGHAHRDVAIARELQALVPDLEIDWLAQDPVTRVLAAEGECIHPASAHLASESGHIESESAEHDLHCFQTWRRMDEILIHNFMVFHDVVEAEPYDLWIGDEAWELDYYLHENPELKRAAYAWITDFVGWLPMPDGGQREASLTADYNAEMLEHVTRFPRVRDRAIFIGDPEDIVAGDFGPGLPVIRDWTEQHFDFPGYVSGFKPAAFADRDALRSELGYGQDERVCIVSVGGSGVGEHLLRRVIDAHPHAASRVPGLRTIVVAGPRIALDRLPRHPGLEVVGYVHRLYRHLAACDLAIVQGGLTTAMELTANRRPFLYFPLKHHFEQNIHVRHRLQRYRAGRRMDIDDSPPEAIATAISEEIGREVDYRPVENDGAHRAATLLAELL
jgi:pimeloyl-ACP methyl ester carboxylesterase/predicted glycosyltransferase